MSTLRVNTIQNAAGSGDPTLNGTAKAWVNFNGTGTVAIRAAMNVSSITDNGTGDYTVNFTTAMSDANYSVTGISSGYFSQGNPQGSFITINTNTTPTTSAVRIFSRDGFSTYDSTYIDLAIFR